MRFMILVKASAQTEAGVMPDDALVARMMGYHEELARAGVLLDASGLRPSRDGWRIRYGHGAPTLVDGPFTETGELVAGYTLIEVHSREEALEWTRRYPNPAGEGAEVEIEVRPLYAPEDFVADAALQHGSAAREGGAA